ncbi:hypothetical protein [Roseisolibacter sp. H3M3-2]|uniref:hypothetical protein n=1 Tax=Roseisolibacter sp. H3M3-2 TaxID=3031323 RepID=UPI0023DC7A7D|nr:hypothetical protein [Roseisolibacter sp. H3M3-2]
MRSPRFTRTLIVIISAACGAPAAAPGTAAPLDSATAVARARAAVAQLYADSLRVHGRLNRGPDRVFVELSLEEVAPGGQGRGLLVFPVQVGPGDSVSILRTFPASR